MKISEPSTSNIGLIIPNTGDLVGTWGPNAVVPDFVAIDGYFGGVQTIGVSGSNVTLTAPAGYTASPSAGPTQSQNAVLRFTGTMSINVQVTLPLPGFYIIENLTTAGGNILQFKAAGSGQVLCVDRGDIQHIYNDGTNVRFVNMGRVGHVEIWAGYSSMPAWVLNCTVPPFLLCDGSIYNFSTYPYLGAQLGSAFGGNGVTTFGVPDLRGRVALPYDGTGARITVGGSGIGGTTIGSAGGDQNPQQHSHAFSGTTGTMNQNATHAHAFTALQNAAGAGVGGGGSFGSAQTTNTQSTNTDHAHNFSGTTSPSGPGFSGNVQPSQVTGIAVIKAA